jgi:hypothetical protein
VWWGLFTAPVLQKGTQRSGQKLGCLQMQLWRSTLYKPHHILGTQSRQNRRPARKAVHEELAGKPRIVDDRRLRQRPVFSQVPSKCLGALLSRAQLSRTYLFGRDCALITQKIEELSQCSGVTFTNPLPSRAISKVLRRRSEPGAAASNASILAQSSNSKTRQCRAPEDPRARATELSDR